MTPEIYMTDVLRAVKEMDKRAYGVLARADYTLPEFQAASVEIFENRYAGPYTLAIWYLAMEKLGLTAHWMGDASEWGPWWTEALAKARERHSR